MSWQAIRLAPGGRIGDDPIAMSSPCDILCVGAAHWDVIGRSPWRIAAGGDVPGDVARSPGGVALNIALSLAGAGLRPGLLCAVGGDADGDALLDAAATAGVDVAHVWRMPGRATDRYVAIEDPDGLVAAISDAATLEAAAGAVLAPLESGGGLAGWRGPLIADGNLPAGILGRLLQTEAGAAGDVRLVPASPAKAARLRGLLGHPRLTIYGNLAEARAVTGTAPDDSTTAARALCAMGFVRAVITDGPRPAADASRDSLATLAPRAVAVRRVTGAGDCFIAAHVAATLQGATPGEALAHALAQSAGFVAAAQ
jgi:pseudouridine kinase